MDLDQSNVLVTGGAGFVASHIADLCVDKGAFVTVLDDFSEGKESNLAYCIDRGANLVNGDIRDSDFVDDLMSSLNIDIVFHLAADASVPRSVEDPVKHLGINIGGTTNVFSSAAKQKVEKVVFASSASVYGNPKSVPIRETDPLLPVSPYGASKLSGEHIGMAMNKSLDLPFVAFRILNAYGARQRHNVKFDFLMKLLKNPRSLEVLGTGLQIRDYIYVTDVARAFVLGAESDMNSGVFNISSGIPTTITEVAEAIVNELNLDAELFFTGKSWPGDVDALVGDNTLIKSELGWEPTISFQEGVSLLTKWFLEEYQSEANGK